MKATATAAIQPMPDQRGKHPPANKIERTMIEQHIEAFNPQISHYRREHAPLRRYLPSDVTVTVMYEDFMKKNPSIKCCYQTYRKFICDLKISFTKLGEEQCEICEMHSISQHSEGNEASPACECDECNQWRQHIARAREARDLYKSDSTAQWSTDYSVRSVDLQKVIMLPRMPGIKSAVFTKRIIAFHETFTTVGKMKIVKSKKRTISVVWHEGTAGRKAEEITAAFIKAMKFERDCKHIVYWLDNCSAQNKNWCLYTSLVSLVNSHDVDAEDITLKYFEAGHTFMSADSFHHGVEQQMRKQPDGSVYDFDDFCDVIKTTNSGKVDVMIMNYGDFIKFSPAQCQRKLKGSNRPMLSDIVEVQLKRGSRHLHYKTSYSQCQYSSFDFLKKAFKLAMPTALLRADARG